MLPAPTSPSAAAAGIAIYRINPTDPTSLELVSQTPLLNMVQLQLFDFGEGGSLEVPVITEWTDSSQGVSGLCAAGSGALLSSGKKVFYFDPATLDTGKSIGSQYTSVQYTDMSQCPVVIGDYIFTGLRYKGTFNILKLSEDRKKATTVKKLTLHANHGVTVSDGECYYLPLGYGGIVSFELD